MDSEPLVSVLMTAYNRSKYIGGAIGSVLASTYRNFELIVVDDGSKDNTVGIAREYASRDSRVKVYVNEKNLGDYPNRNKAASYATGKYLKYVDADDMIYPWGLEVMVSCMEKFPEAAYGLCSFEQNNEKIYPLQLSPAEAYLQAYTGKGTFSRAPLSSIIRRDIFEKEGGFSSLRMTGDFEMWHRLSLQYPVVIMPKGLIWYRIHDAQEMNHFHLFLFDYNKISLDYLRHPLCPLDASLIAPMEKRIIKYSSRKLMQQVLKGKLAFSREKKNKLQWSWAYVIKNSIA